MFWHRRWIDCGRPHHGAVADVMRKTRAWYHVAIRKTRQHEANIVNERFAVALSDSRNRDFWQEVKRIRCRQSNISRVVDGQSSAADIADIVATEYRDLYTSVSYNNEDMQHIRDELNLSITEDGYENVSFINTNVVINAFAKLKSGKHDGSLGLCIDHFKNACYELAFHVSLLFSAMMIHGIASRDMYSCTLIPIPKGKKPM